MTAVDLLREFLAAPPEDRACVSSEMLADLVDRAHREVEDARREPQLVIDDPAGFVDELHTLVTRRPRGRPGRPRKIRRTPGTF
jgi:hypothetical protein